VSTDGIGAVAGLARLCTMAVFDHGESVKTFCASRIVHSVYGFFSQGSAA
jgi:hypothetical protein